MSSVEGNDCTLSDLRQNNAGLRDIQTPSPNALELRDELPAVLCFATGLPAENPTLLCRVKKCSPAITMLTGYAIYFLLCQLRSNLSAS
jgi:hypothetical protein